MNSVETIYQYLRDGKPVAFLKINDGECAAMADPNAGLARGLECSSELMSAKLREAINHQAEGYFVGTPCSVCHPGHLGSFKENLNRPFQASDFIPANSLINNNINTTLQVLQDIARTGDRHIVVVASHAMIERIDRLSEVGIPINQTFAVSEQRAFEHDYVDTSQRLGEIPDGSLVIFLCGPLGRVLTYEWFRDNRTLTCLELGSYFDPILRDKSYVYHTGNHQKCNECYPGEVTQQSRLLDWCNVDKLDKECYYFNDLAGHLHWFGGLLERAEINLRIRLGKNPGDGVAVELLRQVEQMRHPPKHPIPADYRNNTKSGLYNLCSQFYNERNLVELDRVCDLYLEYFGDFHEDGVRHVRFWSGFANFDVDHSKAIHQFEKVYDDPELLEHERFFTMCNLDRLYSRSMEPIPKTIHLIYSKERDLQLYHYGCVASMLQHMPDYQIIIYNDIEPTDNEYWQRLRQHPRVRVEHYPRPTEFDGLTVWQVQYAADIARLSILYEHGGIYMDLDLLLVKGFDELLATGHELYLSEESPGNLINSIVAAKPKNEFVKIWLDSFKTGLRMENWAWHIREGNRILLDRHPHLKLKHRISIWPQKNFLSFAWPEYHKFADIEAHLEPDIYGIHLFDTIHHGLLTDNVYFKRFSEDSSETKVKDVPVTQGQPQDRDSVEAQELCEPELCEPELCEPEADPAVVSV